MEDKTISMTMEGLGPWSYSKMKCLINCPFQFYLKYIHKLKTPATRSPESMIGSAAHKVLELHAVGKSLDNSIEEARHAHHEEMGEELWNEVLKLRESFIAFKERLDKFNEQHPIKRILVEMRIGVTNDFSPTTFFADNVFFRGIIDLVLLLENNDAVFIDHKTGGSAKYGIKNYRQQLNSQVVLFHNGVTEIDGGTVGIHFINEREIKLDSHIDRKTIETDLQKELLYSIDNAVHRVIELGYFKHIAGNSCKWCEFAGPCKAGTLKELEQSTRKFIPICSKQ